MDCGREVEIDLRTAKKVICPFCGYRVIKKTRPQVIKKVKAR
jgi:DNA-directed RNA polymerase subunit RPC12/RpoP